jgi:hypothetical protein
MLVGDVLDSVGFEKRQNPLIEDLLQIPSKPRVALTRLRSPPTLLE